MEIYQRPSSRFVAGFIGAPAMNFLSVTRVEARGGRAVAWLCDGSSVATEVPMAAVGDGRGLTLGVRAENVQPGGGTAARVDVIERLGERTLVYANLADGSTIVYDEPGDVRLAVGETVHLTIDGATAHLFDAQGRSLHG
jgi:multiple sugar transport system ATP-binding protein